jgi:arsenate reductase
MKIYYNARCSKCRDTLCLIKKSGENPEIIDYLKNPIDLDSLKQIVKILGIKPEALVRKKEPLYIEKFKDKNLSDLKWLKALCKYPILIQRPIVIKGDKAIIGRPPEGVLALINS